MKNTKQEQWTLDTLKEAIDQVIMSRGYQKTDWARDKVGQNCITISNKHITNSQNSATNNEKQ